MNKEIEIKHGKALADEYIKGKPFVEYHAMLKKAFIDGFTSNRIYINGGVVVESPAPVDDVVDAIGNLEIQGEDESMIKLREIGTLVDDIMNCIPDRQPEVDALKEEVKKWSSIANDLARKGYQYESENALLKKRVEELEGKYESDKDNDYEETLPEFCSNCGAEYDEIDYEYQICHLCGCGQTTTEKTNNH